MLYYSLLAKFQSTLDTSWLCSCQFRMGKLSRACTSHILIDPSALALTSWFSFASFQQQSYSPSCVSKCRISTTIPAPSIWRMCCRPFPMIP